MPKNYNKIHENLQTTHAIFNKTFIHSSEIIITYEYSRKIEKNTDTMFKF